MVVLFKEATMELDVTTFLTTVYCIVDDLYQEHFAPDKPRRPGKRPEMSDSEVLTVTILAQWQQDRSERAFLAYACRHWRSYFPRLLSQSAFNRRARDLCGVLSRLGPLVARQLTQTLTPTPAYTVLDTVPVPLMRRCRGGRHRLFADEADFGHGGSDDEVYYGVQLLAVVNAAGLITGFVVGPAATDERWLAEALLRWRTDPTAAPPTLAELAPVLGPSHRRGGQRRGPTGPIAPGLGVGEPDAVPYLGDLGFHGAAWQQHWQAAYGASVLTKAAYDALARPERRQARRWFCGLRQVIETVNGQLEGTFGLQFPRARTYWGLLTRLAAKVAAFNLSVAFKHHCDQPTLAAINPLTA
jgi:hypothetical protein